MSKKSKSQPARFLQIALFAIAVLSGIFLHSKTPLINFLIGLILFGIVIYFHKTEFALFGPCLFFLMVYLTGFLPFATLGVSLIIPLILYLALMMFYRRLKEKSFFIKIGKTDSFTWLIGLAIVLVSSLTLYFWAKITDPNLNDLLSIMPRAGLGTLLLFGIIFAIVNSIVEESIYRGILYDSLGHLFKSRPLVLLIQAAVFGLAHFSRGFPRGAIGVTLAFIYGIMLGIVRDRTKGLLAPIIFHIAADFTIFLILLGLLGKL